VRKTDNIDENEDDERKNILHSDDYYLTPWTEMVNYL